MSAGWVIRKAVDPLGLAVDLLGPNLRSGIRFAVTDSGVRVYSYINGDPLTETAQRILIDAFMRFGWGLNTELSVDLRSAVSLTFTHPQFLATSGD